MADASEFMRASDSHGHSVRMALRVPSDFSDRLYTLIHEDRGIEYRNLADGCRDWLIDGATAFAERLEDEDLLRAASAWSLAIRVQVKLDQFEAERDLIKNIDEALRRRVSMSEDELLAAMGSIQNEDNLEDFRRMLLANRINLP